MCCIVLNGSEDGEVVKKPRKKDVNVFVIFLSAVSI